MTPNAQTPHKDALLDDRFQLVQKLDPLGAGRVWKATDTHSGDAVVIKFAPEQPGQMSARDYRELVESFVRESQALLRLDSPNVVRAVAVGDGGNDWPAYVARAYLDGETLGSVLDHAGSGTPLPAHDVLDLARAVLPPLAELNEQGVYARALLPEHIVRCRAAGGGYDYVLLDFGAARSGSSERWGVLESPRKFASIFSQNRADNDVPPAYRPPEYLDAKRHTWDARSDVWTAGVLLWWLSAGSLPFDAADPEVESLIRSGTRPDYVDRAPAAAHWLRAPLDAALSTNPTDRPQTLLELLEQIVEAHAGGAVMADTKPTAQPESHPAPQQVAEDKPKLELVPPASPEPLQPAPSAPSNSGDPDYVGIVVELVAQRQTLVERRAGLATQLDSLDVEIATIDQRLRGLAS